MALEFPPFLRPLEGLCRYSVPERYLPGPHRRFLSFFFFTVVSATLGHFFDRSASFSSPILFLNDPDYLWADPHQSCSTIPLPGFRTYPPLLSHSPFLVSVPVLCFFSASPCFGPRFWQNACNVIFFIPSPPLFFLFPFISCLYASHRPLSIFLFTNFTPINGLSHANSMPLFSVHLLHTFSPPFSLPHASFSHPDC